MKHAITDIVEKLKAARETRGISQRELSQLAGVPQSHISKIESGNVDLRVSSLNELARALGLELTLVPRNVLPAVNTIAWGSLRNPQKPTKATQTIQRELKRIENSITNLIRENPTNTQLAQIQSQAKDLQRLHVPDSYLETIRQAGKSLRSIPNPADSMGTIGKMLAEFQQLRNSLVHRLDQSIEIEKTRPAYSLDENNDG